MRSACYLPEIRPVFTIGDNRSNCLLRRCRSGWIIEPCPALRYLQCFLSEEERGLLNFTNPLLTLGSYVVSMHRTER